MKWENILKLVFFISLAFGIVVLLLIAKEPRPANFDETMHFDVEYSNERRPEEDNNINKNNNKNNNNLNSNNEMTNISSPFISFPPFDPSKIEKISRFRSLAGQFVLHFFD